MFVSFIIEVLLLFRMPFFSVSRVKHISPHAKKNPCAGKMCDYGKPKSNDNANSRLSRRTKNPKHCSHGPDQRCNFLYEIKTIGKKLLAKQSRSSCAVLDDAFLTEGAVAIGKLTTLQV